MQSDTNLALGQHSTLRCQLLSVCLITVIVGGALAGELARFIEEAQATRTLQAQSERVVRVFSATAIEAVISQDVPVLQTNIEQLLKYEPALLSVSFQNDAGRLLIERFRTEEAGPDTPFMRFSGNIGFEGETFGSVNLSWDPSNYWQNIDRQIWLARALGMGTALTLSLCFYLWTLILVLRPVEYIHRRLLALRETGVPSQLTAQRFRTRELGALCQLVDQLGSSMSDSNSHNEALSSAHAAKEEALAQMKSNFAANVSHELRTPLNGVLGMLQLLKDANLTVEEREFVDIATRSGRSLLTLIGDVLDFSKSESGMLMLEELNFDLHALLKRTVSPFQSLAADKGLSLHLVVAADVPRFVRGDPTRLGQVIGNLLSNAIKFTNRGHVELRAGRANDGDDVTSLQFEVEDTGIGLTEAAQERVFQPFTQADASTTRKYGGTGLGLSICWQLVSQMGGEISLRSQHHHGSTFAFTIALRMRIGVVPNAVPRWSERATKPPGRAATRSWWSTTVQ